MQFTFQVSAEVERSTGPFASRDDLEAQLQEAIDGANPGSVQPGDNDYDVVTWEVEALQTAKASKTKTGDGVNAMLITTIRAHTKALQELRELAEAVDAPLLTDTAKRLQNSHDGLVAALVNAKLIRMP